MSDLESLCAFAQQQKSSDLAISSFTKVNIVRVMASVAGAAIAKSATSPTDAVVEFVEKITNLLLGGYHTDCADLVLQAEILDSLIDMYSDDNALTTHLLKRMNLLTTLHELAGQYRQQVSVLQMNCWLTENLQF